MSNDLKAVKGMNDILPENISYWHYIENQLKKLAKSYGYEEIRTPVLEKTELFKRSIGDTTDIVAKEMYTFEDRDGSSLTLRPEGTACVVRAGLEHGLFYNQTQKLWYLGPIYRHERPQRGRYRQFYQFGLEAIGFAGAQIEVEQILFNLRLWQLLGIDQEVTLEINTLGDKSCRENYREILVAYFKAYEDKLDADSKIRLDKNPLRILDSKNPQMQTLIHDAPKLMDNLNDAAKKHFESLQTLLNQLNVKYVVNPHLVRGLDYYSHTVFEWTTDKLGAQGTISAGGRYDALITQLGGKEMPAAGFAMGIERIIELLKLNPPDVIKEPCPDIFLMSVGSCANTKALILAEQLRQALPSLILNHHIQGGSFKSQMKKADKSGSELCLILGEDEVSAGTVAIKYLREQKPQASIDEAIIITFLQKYFNSKGK